MNWHDPTSRPTTQALCAVLFLYRAVLHVDLPAIVPMVRVRTPPRLPTVLNRSEVRSVLAHLTGEDRMTMLPGSVAPGLVTHLVAVKALHDADLAHGFGAVTLPDALDAKYPNAARSWPWQFVFPAARICRNPNGARAPGPRRCQHHDDLHPRTEPRWTWRS